ncbi:unnamed protein product [Echinostoma caproni]|uniref:Helicase ATP-binding domain-containing protein n=1 Tax=Echinostoma caproni TaxID=27848 RepID=A0A183ACN8_9TREM|nr:unnamed protein product [Echinostoma caproni]
MARAKGGRGRGRLNTVPLDDMMESKIRTYEGRDCVQQLDQLHRLFPRFKRAYINRIFTKNFLNYDKTFQELNAENEKYLEKCANVRLIQGSKNSDSKRDSKSGNRADLTPLNPEGLLYLDIPLGKCPPQIASTLYRRVIVNPDGTVESAEEHEKKYLDSNGITTPVLKPPCLPPPKVRPFPTPPLQIVNLPLPDPMIPLGEELDNPQPAAAKGPTPAQSGNRFFRTNRVCETEIKKRGYVDRELRTSVKSTPSSRRSRNALALKPDADSGDTSDSKEGDAATYMASVGVVSTPLPRKRKTKSPKDESRPTAVPVPDDGLSLTNEERRQIMEFFNEASSEELSLMSGCSQKTAQILMSLRPFDNTTHLLNRLSGTRFLSPNLIDSCKEVLQMRMTVVRLLQRCESIAERVSKQIAQLLANSVAMPTEDIPESSSLLTQQPSILNPLRELKPYQLVGLNWLRLLHQEKVNGILADEMGLGKTIQAIAFLASLRENGDRGPHLIICPSSTQANWQRELADWCPHLKVLVYQGSVEQRKAMRLSIYDSTAPEFNVLLTSYVMGTSTIEDRVLMKRLNFHYGIFDEAHMLKNMLSHRYKHLANFHVQRRLLLTGTPLQNNLMELVSLLAFVMPEMFGRTTELLKRMFPSYSHIEYLSCFQKPPVANNNNTSDENSSPQSTKFELERLEQAKNLLKPFFLRRLKSQVNESRVFVNGDETISSNNSPESLSNMLWQLRKAANHQTLLNRIAYSEDQLQDIAEALHLDSSHSNSDVKLIYEDLKVLNDHQVHRICQHYEILSPYALPIAVISGGSGKIAWLEENVPKLVAQNHRLLIFSQFVLVLDILEEFLRFKDWRYVRLDGGTPVDERQRLIDRFNRPVHVIRLISEGTIEERILNVASEKLQLEENVTGAASGPTFEEMDPTVSTVGISDMSSNHEELPEPDVTQQILGSSRYNLKRNQAQSEASTLMRSHRLTERELSSLLADALKTNP